MKKGVILFFCTILLAIFIISIVYAAKIYIPPGICFTGYQIANKCLCHGEEGCGPVGGACGACYLTFSLDYKKSNLNYTLDLAGNFSNWKNSEINFSYEWFLCKCDEKNGDPFQFGGGTCNENWPFSQFVSGNFLDNCVGMGRINVTLGVNQTILVMSNITQYKEKRCGMIQEYLQVYDLNGNTHCGRNVLKGWVSFCKNCTEPKCGDGIIDDYLNEECDDNNSNCGTTYCHNKSKCIGSDYYYYDDLINNCMDCKCENKNCSVKIFQNDPRCACCGNFHNETCVYAGTHIKGPDKNSTTPYTKTTLAIFNTKTGKYNNIYSDTCMKRRVGSVSNYYVKEVYCNKNYVPLGDRDSVVYQTPAEWTLCPKGCINGACVA